MSKKLIIILVGIGAGIIIALIILFGVRKEETPLPPQDQQLKGKQTQEFPRASDGSVQYQQQSVQEQQLTRVLEELKLSPDVGYAISNTHVIGDNGIATWIDTNAGGMLIAKKINGEWKVVGGDGGLLSPRYISQNYQIPIEDARALLEVYEPRWRDFVAPEEQ